MADASSPPASVWLPPAQWARQGAELADRLESVADTLEELVGLAPGEDQLFDDDDANSDELQ